MTLRYPRIIAHRGGGALAPENTLAGLRVAARIGCRGVEFDAMLSRDDVPVVIHDETLDRTTDTRGVVAAMDDAALSGVDAGVRHGAAWRGEPLPRLEDALRLCDELGLWANIEIKPSAGRDAETGVAIAACLETCWNGVGVVSSFSIVALSAVLECAPKLPRALLVEAIPSDAEATLRELRCIALHAKAALCDPVRVDALAQEGYLVACYTANDRVLADRLLNLGVAAIFTDRPDLWDVDEM